MGCEKRGKKYKQYMDKLERKFMRTKKYRLTVECGFHNHKVKDNVLPQVIVSDMDLAFMNALENPLDKISYNARFKSFITYCAHYKTFVDYVQQTWLMPFKEKFHKVEGTHAILKLFHDSMGDLYNCWDTMNNMFVLQHTSIKASFQKSINVVEHMFITLVYKKLCGFVSREAQDLIFHELQRVDTIGIDSYVCGCTLKVTHGLPCACELIEFICIYGCIPLKSIHGDLTLTHEVDALFKRFSQLNVSGKITLKTKVSEFAFPDITSMCPPATKIKTKGSPKSMKSTKREPSMCEHVNEMNTMVGSSRTPTIARKGEREN
ncbi:hypothetical protein GmHk_05G013299 [Glycine max]|nr:hypothetical protein GmHk_05G013299 [Glycine max]